MVDVSVDSKDVSNLVWAIRRHADAKVIRRELYRGLSSASRPVREEMRDAALSSLPARGGLQARMTGLVGKGRTSAVGGSGAGVRISFNSAKYDPRTLRGRIRHPLFGNRRLWFTNTASPVDAIDAGFQSQKPAVQREIVRVMEDIAQKVTSA